MIEYISGKIAELTPTYAVIDNHGIGYELNISLTTYSELENKSEIKLLAHEVIREDAHIIFGFATKNERELFRLLIGVSGVGANTARMILSSITPPELEQVITSGDDKRLKGVKGVGVKTAQRIIVDLKDKIKPVGWRHVIYRANFIVRRFRRSTCGIAHARLPEASEPKGSDALVQGRTRIKGGAGNQESADNALMLERPPG